MYCLLFLVLSSASSLTIVPCFCGSIKKMIKCSMSIQYCILSLKTWHSHRFFQFQVRTAQSLGMCVRVVSCNLFAVIHFNHVRLCCTVCSRPRKEREYRYFNTYPVLKHWFSWTYSFTAKHQRDPCASVHMGQKQQCFEKIPYLCSMETASLSPPAPLTVVFFFFFRWSNTNVVC